MQASNEKTRAKASRYCHPRYCVAALQASQVYPPRRPHSRRTGHAGKGRRRARGGGRKVTLIPRQSLTSRARLGGAFQLTKQGGDSPRALLPVHARCPSEAVRGPPTPDYPSASAIYGEVRMGRGGWDGDGGGETRSRRCSGRLATVAAVCKGPPAPRAPLPALGGPRGGRGQQESGGGRRRSLRRGHDPAPAPLPPCPSSACGSAAPEASLQGPGNNFSLEPPDAPGIERAPIWAPAPRASSYLARPPSIFSYCFHSHTLK